MKGKSVERSDTLGSLKSIQKNLPESGVISVFSGCFAKSVKKEKSREGLCPVNGGPRGEGYITPRYRSIGAGEIRDGAMKQPRSSGKPDLEQGSASAWA